MSFPGNTRGETILFLLNIATLVICATARRDLRLRRLTWTSWSQRARSAHRLGNCTSVLWLANSFPQSRSIRGHTSEPFQHQARRYCVPNEYRAPQGLQGKAVSIAHTSDSNAWHFAIILRNYKVSTAAYALEPTRACGACQAMSNSRILPSGSCTRKFVLPKNRFVGGSSGSMPARLSWSYRACRSGAFISI